MTEAGRGRSARRDADVVQLLHAFFRLVSWMGGGWQLLANFVAALDLDSPSSFGPLDSLVPRWSALRQAMTPDIARVFHNTMPASACESVFGCRSIFQDGLGAPPSSRPCPLGGGLRFDGCRR